MREQKKEISKQHRAVMTFGQEFTPNARGGSFRLGERGYKKDENYVKYLQKIFRI
jgi:hypothetical protein